ncbi:hypothetical protein [Psychroserpens sp. SPM9]|uniref:hypothetical protein n=1 Tax=Psychroserpens sp. SPM9 TaxID=2975598 RepID=UPI0021A6401E|nr:hypothetical protein [Psychroserpens sp. SPM9]MDG5491246.1 hypothetical protein [Psychroserpens sp. SPM9]
MYQSIVDLLDISPEDLLNIDDAQIIRFEKILKSKIVIDHSSFNTEDTHHIISVLRDPKLRKYFYMIEKHPKLKAFLTSKAPLESKTLTINSTLISKLEIDVNQFRSFIEPYLKPLLLPQLKQAINTNAFAFVLDNIKTDDLYSESLKFECQQLILNKIRTTIHLLETHPNLKTTKYIKENSFGALVKHSASGYGLELTKTYIETLVKQLKQVHSRSKNANHYYQGLLATSHANIENNGINRFVEAHINNHVSRTILDKKTPDEWGIQVLLTIAVLGLTMVIAMVLKSYNENQVIKKYSAKDVTNFYQSFNDTYGKHLTKDANGVLKNIEGQLILKAYKYPYDINNDLYNPLFFPFYETFPKANTSTPHTLTIENLDSDKSLIVFRKNKYNHCELLPPRSRLTTFVAPKDSLIFYRGKFLNIDDYGGLSIFNGIFKHSSKADRLRFFQVYIVDSKHKSKHARIQMKQFGTLSFQNLNTKQVTTSYVGENIIDLAILESYLD